jgi:hypothetical protein
VWDVILFAAPFIDGLQEVRIDAHADLRVLPKRGDKARHDS